jgi:hypothetical protein
MKKYISVLLFTLLFISCQKVEDVVKADDTVNLVIMESAKVPGALPGDTTSFKVLASTNGWLSKVTMTNLSTQLTSLSDKVLIGLVEEATSLDSDGNLSRPVKTILITYPIAIAKIAEIVGDTLTADFYVENKSGKGSSITTKIKIINFIMHGAAYYAWSNNFYDADTHKSKKYSRLNTDDYQIMDIYRHDNADGTKIFLSPDNAKVADDISGYDPSVMNHTEFIVLDDDVSFDKITDTFLENMDFTNPVSEFSLTVKNVEKLFGFKTAEGKRGIFAVQIKFNKYASVRNIIQSVVK